MMRRLISIVAFCCIAMVSAEAKSRNFGAGIVIGNPTGICGKYWIDNKHAVDGVISIPDDNKVYLHGDYLWHDYNAFPKPEEGSLPLYYGVGAVVSVDKVGARGVAGVSYRFAGYPFDLFIELAPVFAIAPDIGLSINGGLGGRYYFGS